MKPTRYTCKTALVSLLRRDLSWLPTRDIPVDLLYENIRWLPAGDIFFVSVYFLKKISQFTSYRRVWGDFLHKISQLSSIRRNLSSLPKLGDISWLPTGEYQVTSCRTYLTCLLAGEISVYFLNEGSQSIGWLPAGVVSFSSSRKNLPTGKISLQQL